MRLVSDHRAVAAGLVLFFGTLILFSRALNGQFLDCDDPDYVTQNPHVQGGFTWANVRWAFTSGDAANWHPLTWLSHMLDAQLFPQDPVGPHAVNLLLHALNAVLVFGFVRQLGGAAGISFVLAALFAWHPLRVESVAWVAERKDVLSTFFGLVALRAYVAYASKRPEQQCEQYQLYALTLAAFAAGLMCKPMLVTLPFVWLLLDVWPLGRFQWWTSAREKIPFLALSAAACVVTYHVQKNAGAIIENLSWLQRLAGAVMAVAGYLAKFFWPFGLALGYPRPIHWPAAELAAATLLLLAITGVAWWQRRTRPWISIGWLWFCGMLVPVLGLVPAGLQSMADRYTYLPVLGLELAVFWTWRDVAWNDARCRLAVAVAALVLAGCGWRTWDQQLFWHDSETLYRHALAVDEANYNAHCFLGGTLFDQDRLAEAEQHFRRALELKPDLHAALYRLGLVLEKTGRFPEALAAYNQLLKLRPLDAKTWFQAGVTWEEAGREDAALTNYITAARLDSGLTSATYNAGVILLNQDQPQAALDWFQKAVRYDPEDTAAQIGAGLAEKRLGHGPESRRYLNAAYQRNPHFPGLAELISPSARELAGELGKETFKAAP